jgi:hypothetical protein
MYKNAYNKKLERAVKTLLVHCDRGDVVKAEAAVNEVELTTDQLLDFTRERMRTKKQRETPDVIQPKAQPPKQSESPLEKASGDKKGPGRPSTKVQSDNKK